MNIKIKAQRVALKYLKSLPWVEKVELFDVNEFKIRRDDTRVGYVRIERNSSDTRIRLKFQLLGDIDPVILELN